ncbi:MAG: Hsp20/alpha crystallin family protein [Pseudomonadota bacterium]
MAPRIPWNTLSDIKDQAERVFTDLLGKGAWNRPPTWDLIERPVEFVLLAELPGVIPESIDVRLSGNALTIKAERRQEPPEPEEVYHVAERSSGPVSRTLALPAGVDPSAVRADYCQGVLRVRMQKTPRAEARRIEVE